MVACLSIGCILTLLAEIGIFVGAKSAVHEIEGLLLVLISAIFCSALAILDKLDRVSRSSLPEEHTQGETAHQPSARGSRTTERLTRLQRHDEAAAGDREGQVTSEQK